MVCPSRAVLYQGSVEAEQVGSDWTLPLAVLVLLVWLAVRTVLRARARRRPPPDGDGDR